MNKSKLLWTTLGIVLVAGLVWVIAAAPKTQAPQGAPETQTPAPVAKQTSNPPPAPTSDKKSVSIQNFAFNPADTILKRGGKITFTNNDNVTHNITFEAQVYGVVTLAPGQSETIDTTAFPPGTYNYHCGIHPSMKGVLTLQ